MWRTLVCLSSILTLAGCSKPAGDPAAQEKLQEKIKIEGYPRKGPRTPGGQRKEPPPANPPAEEAKDSGQ